jgi:hypothetical protein
MSHRETRDRRLVALLAVIALAAGTGPAFGQTVPDRQGTVEFSFGSYNVADPLFDTIYQPGGSIGGLGFTAGLLPHIDFYFDLKVMVKNGLLSHSQDTTTFVMIPISMGVRYAYPVSFIIPFAGAGFDYYAYVEDNPIGTVLDNAAGLHFLAGFYLRFGERFPILPFARLKYALVKAGPSKIDLGGWEFGGGLAIAF